MELCQECNIAPKYLIIDGRSLCKTCYNKAFNEKYLNKGKTTIPLQTAMPDVSKLNNEKYSHESCPSCSG